jgi:hypothetical protein
MAPLSFLILMACFFSGLHFGLTDVEGILGHHPQRPMWEERHEYSGVLPGCSRESFTTLAK